MFFLVTVKKICPEYDFHVTEVCSVYLTALKTILTECDVLIYYRNLPEIAIMNVSSRQHDRLKDGSSESKT